jgi:hypothetical protein
MINRAVSSAHCANRAAETDANARASLSVIGQVMTPATPLVVTTGIIALDPS